MAFAVTVQLLNSYNGYTDNRKEQTGMKYPIGVQNFEIIREMDYCYVDKTELGGVLTFAGKLRE